MFATCKMVGSRINKARTTLGVLIVSLLAALLYTMPATAQTPDTVVFPPVYNHMPFISGGILTYEGCPATSTNQYTALNILGEPRSVDFPPAIDPDINLMMRGYSRTSAILDLIAIDGPTDDDAPQLAYLFRPARVAEFTAVHRVNDWNWDCCQGGILGPPIREPEVTLVEMKTTPGEAIYAPRRNASIGGDFYAMVLYAEPTRITFTYTLDDSPVYGYLMHIENFCVDPNLLALYEEMHAAGRIKLPALRRDDSIGTALNTNRTQEEGHQEGVLVAVRDTGAFMDPRSAKDWWQDTVRAMLAGQGKLP